MPPHEVVVGEVERHGGAVVPQLLGEGVGQPGHPADGHPHREVLALHVGGGRAVHVGLASDGDLVDGRDLWRGIAARADRFCLVRFDHLGVVDRAAEGPFHGVDVEREPIGGELHLIPQAAKAQARANEFAIDYDLSVPFPDIQTPQAATGSRIQIRPDQFANHTAPSGATREYLELRGSKLGAATLEEIFEALHAGGFAFSSPNPTTAMGGLKVALGKDKRIRQLRNGTFGLWVWYPNARRDDDKPESEAKDSDDKTKDEEEKG